MDTIGIIGLGNMGEAILKALLKTGHKKNNILCMEAKSDRIAFIKKIYGIECSSSIEELAKKARIIVLAVKPQDSRDPIEGIAPYIAKSTTLVSIMAGVTISNILTIVGKQVKIVRLMPNVCVKVGEGAIGITSNNIVTKNDIDLVKRIFSPLGKIAEVGEELMDAVTALAGSGPALFLLFLEGMIDGGVKMGIPRDKASVFAIQVAKGTVRMLEEEGLHPVLMREMVTSPGGTTMAGLASMEEDGFKGSIIKAIEKATMRAKELSL
jgi:pyrroline-5-carboxylate reductase